MNIISSWLSGATFILAIYLFDEEEKEKAYFTLFLSAMNLFCALI